MGLDYLPKISSFDFRGDGNFEMFNNGGRSCRISSVGDGDLRKCRKSSKI